MIRCASLLISIMTLLISRDAKAGLTEVGLYISNAYDQSSTGVTSFTGYDAFFEVFMQSASDFNGGTVARPAGPYIPTTLVPQIGDPLVLHATNPPLGFPTLAALNATFPFGTYTVTATNSVTAATKAVTLNYTKNYFPIPAVPPQLTPTSYAGLQGLNAGSAFDLQFNSIIPNNAATKSQIFFEVYGPAGANVFSQNIVGQPPTSLIFRRGHLLPAPHTPYRCFFSRGTIRP